MGGHTGKESTIDCTKAQELFFERAEKALSRAELDALLAHEASCRECRCSFEEWGRLRSALRQPELKVAAPPEFTRGVMARIAEVAPEAAAARAGAGARLIGHLKGGLLGRGLAAAAVILALLTGSLSLTTRLPGLKVANNGAGYKRVVREERSQKGSAVNPQPVTSEKAEKGDGLNQTAPVTPDKPASSGDAAGKPATVAPKDAPRVATGNPVGSGGNGEKVFLNKTRVITTTILKLQVADLQQARSSVIGLAGSEGAYLQSEFTTQNNGHQDIILRLTVPDQEAQPFIGRLSGLGTPISPPQVSREDITASFASTLKEYQALKAEQATAPADEKERLNNQITFLENQLQSWDEESNKQVVIVLLEEA